MLSSVIIAFSLIFIPLSINHIKRKQKRADELYAINKPLYDKLSAIFILALGTYLTKNSLFYSSWTDEASDLLIKMDIEFFGLLDKLGVSTEHLPTLLQHYEVQDAESLTQKIKNIPAFSNILSPMKQTPNGWVPDFESRYFTEDFPFGLRFIYELAHANNINTPNIDKVYQWGISKINQ